MGVYYNSTTKEWCVANKGSTLSLLDLKTTASNWKNNLIQPFGASADMKYSIKKAKAFVKKKGRKRVSFVGHSKGGAEAAANAVATNTDAIVYNPATVFLNEYGLNSNLYKGNMTAFIVKGEPLNSLFGLISAPIDKVDYLSTQYKTPIFLRSVPGISTAFEVRNYIKNHSMDAVISGLREKGYN